ncbi:septum formation family protein [Corynebacterium sp. ES2715-CONJ3]|uniref:septum formation family protein n=1 Tax=Corynebacterium sp. ES2715-CONJ3 TaxID=2974028 RepID=UPI0021670C3E|nr:septum formation family protein [Corynebacterium sp. ES2715-CONJ3]MCS4492069.1 septum formation family protein [Corynebacterium sp. ES2715-CONJ3]
MEIEFRSATATRIILVAALSASCAMGAYQYQRAQLSSPLVTPVDMTTKVPAASTASFTTADVGSCVTWTVIDGTVSNFEQADCASLHRFEVSSREDLGTYPSSEFGPSAAMPNQTRQAQLREELCLAPTMRYLDAKFDPLGKYSIASILPPQESWDLGDRTLLCGIQATNELGEVIETKGRVQDQDQARISPVGTCLALDASNSTKQVACGKPHQMEITAVIDLLPVFPQSIPSTEEQDNHLSRVCTQAARDYLGGDDPLYFSTLKPFWTTIAPSSWDTGSHSVNCSLVFPVDNRFAVLEGSAKGNFTINGTPPEQRPERAPIINPEALDGVAPPPPR